MKTNLLFLIISLTFSTHILAQTPNYVPKNEIVGYWPFNGNAQDESGNGNNGIVNGATLTSDRFGNSNQAFSFLNNSIKFSNSNFAAFGKNSFSCSIWVKYVNSSNNIGNFVRYGNAINSCGWGIRCLGNGEMNLLEHNLTNNNINSIKNYNDNKWHHVVFVRDINCLCNKLYIDGELVNSKPFETKGINDLIQAAPLNIGTANGYENFFGSIDDFGLWKRALTDLEILGLFESSVKSNVTPKVFSQTGVISTCEALKQTSDFTADQEPSVKKLKKMVGKASRDEVLEYSIYLHDFLLPKNTNSEIKETLKTVVKEYILPMASEGNFKAISFLSGKGYWRSSEALSFISKSSSNNSAVKFARYQLKFQCTENVKYTNKYILSQDSLLKSYFIDFNKTDLIELRDIIDNKINEIEKINNDFNVSSYDYNNSVDVRNSALKKLPAAINDKTFCLSFTFSSFVKGTGYLSIVPKAFDGSTVVYDAVNFLKILRGSIDLILMEENPKSLAQLLFDYAYEEMQNKWTFDYMNPKEQYFAQDKVYGAPIFKLLSAVIPYDTTLSSLKQKSYYLNRAAQLGATDAYFNLACLYQVLYYNTNQNKYNDSCIFYLEKLILSNYPAAFTLKGIKIFNGEGYIQNKEEGIKLILKAKSLGSGSATKLLETLPQKLFYDKSEGYNFKQSVKINYPWDFKVLCSNDCGKYTYPTKIIFGRIYEDNVQFSTQIKRAEFFKDELGNPTINISENDFKNTFTIVHMGYSDWKHVMCSRTCQLDHENKNNSNWDAMKNKRNVFDNEVIKCGACTKVMKRADMLSISGCPCYTETGSSINISFSNDLYGDYDPKVCSSNCQINFCKTKCVSKGYTSKY